MLFVGQERLADLHASSFNLLIHNDTFLEPVWPVRWRQWLRMGGMLEIFPAQGIMRESLSRHTRSSKEGEGEHVTRSFLRDPQKAIKTLLLSPLDIFLLHQTSEQLSTTQQVKLTSRTRRKKKIPSPLYPKSTRQQTFSNYSKCNSPMSSPSLSPSSAPTLPPGNKGASPTTARYVF